MREVECTHVLRASVVRTGRRETVPERTRRGTRNCRAPCFGSAAVNWSCTKAFKRGGVHNVHTFRMGLGRTSAGLARISYVFWSSQCLQGRECGSSPTSGTAGPLVGGVFCFNVCTKLAVASL